MRIARSFRKSHWIAASCAVAISAVIVVSSFHVESITLMMICSAALVAYISVVSIMVLVALKRNHAKATMEVMYTRELLLAQFIVEAKYKDARYSLEFDTWTIDYLLARKLHQIILEYDIGSVIEVGSGLSTKLFANMINMNNGNIKKIVSLEGEEYYYRKLANAMKRDVDDGSVVLCNCSMMRYQIESREYFWYEYTDENGPYDLVFIDGPPINTSNRLSRFPAIPLLENMIKLGAVIVVDDSNRPDDSDVISEWCKYYKMEMVERSFLGKGFCVMRYAGPIGGINVTIVK